MRLAVGLRIPVQSFPLNLSLVRNRMSAAREHRQRSDRDRGLHEPCNVHARPKSLLDAPSRPAQREAVDEVATNRRHPPAGAEGAADAGSNDDLIGTERKLDVRADVDLLRIERRTRLEADPLCGCRDRQERRHGSADNEEVFQGTRIPCCAARILPGHSVVGYVWSSSPGGDVAMVSLGGAADGTRPLPGSRCRRLAGTRASGAAGGSLKLVDSLMDQSDARRPRPD